MDGVYWMKSICVRFLMCACKGGITKYGYVIEMMMSVMEVHGQ